MQMSTRRLWLFLLAITLPSALSLWIANVILNSAFGIQTVGLVRWLSSLLIPIAFAFWGLQRSSLSTSGAVAGFCVGFVITLSSYIFLLCLITFFVSSSKATKFRSHLKEKFEDNFLEGGRRNWVQVLCNGLIGAMIALIYILDCGCQEQTLDFINNYRCSCVSYAFLGALSCSNGDTWASEFGPVLKFSKPVLLTSLKLVPKGTNGGVSVSGLLASLVGGAVVGLAFFVGLHFSVSSDNMVASPPQWPVIVLGGVGGFVGSLVDSFLGATFQYSGLNEEGKIVEHPGPGIKHVSGRYVLDNHAVNLLSTAVTSFLLPFISLQFT